MVVDNNDSKSGYWVVTQSFRIYVVMVDRAGFEPAAFRSVGLVVLLANRTFFGLRFVSIPG